MTPMNHSLDSNSQEDKQRSRYHGRQAGVAKSNTTGWQGTNNCNYHSYQSKYMHHQRIFTNTTELQFGFIKGLFPLIAGLLMSEAKYEGSQVQKTLFIDYSTYIVSL